MTMGAEYSSLKMVRHYIRDGGLPAAPKQVQVILSDLCNQDCNFCLVKDTTIDTPSGPVYIQSLSRGDIVYGPTGRLNEVTASSCRVAQETVEVRVGGNVIRATPEHPFLTARGWVQARDLTERDAAVVRVRVRGAGVDAQGALEQVGSGAPVSRPKDAGPRQAGGQQAYDSRQSDEAARGGDEGLNEDSRGAKESLACCGGQHCGCSETADAVGPQPHEGPSQASGCNGQDSGPAEVQERAAFRAVAGASWPASATDRRRQLLDRATEPGLSCSGPTEAGGVDAEGVLHRPTETTASRGVCNGQHPPLPQQGVGVSGGLSAGRALHDTGGPAGCAGELYVGGICLERGLALRQIDSIRRVPGAVVVYNISCGPDEAYEANGVVVHNCAYRMSGYSSNELFVGDSPLAKTGHNNPIRFMPTARALALVDELKEAGVLAIQFTGGGEPTVHADHELVFRRALDAGLSCALVSNGVKWSAEMRSSLLTKFSWVRVSVDAGTAATYARIRNCPLTHWDTMLRNVAGLAGWIRASHSKCLLGIGWVVTPDNWQELVEGVRVAESTGAAYVRLSAMFNPDDDAPYKEIYSGIKEAIAEAKRRYESSTFTVHDLFGERLDDLRQGRPDYKTCSYQHYTSYIGADLRPYRCCVLAYNRRGIIGAGNLRDVPFDTFWQSEARKQDFAKFDARGCERCQFNKKNQAMSYVLEDTVPHEQFP